MQIKQIIEAFEGSENATLGIILKTNSSAKALFDVLSRIYEVHLISPDSAGFFNGVSITSVQMSKGLEFDEVIIPEANHKNYSTEYERTLLYIACTRALHRLSLTYTGQMTKLIGACLISRLDHPCEICNIPSNKKHPGEYAYSQYLLAKSQLL